MTHLMCMDTPVYATRTKKVLMPNLMPCPAERYVDWRNSRLFLRGVNRMPEEDERILGVDSVTVKRRLSLSDSYWVHYNKDSVSSFSEVTPYTNDFFEYGVSTSRKSSPSLTAGGSVNKKWRRVNGITALYKVMPPAWVIAEVAAISLAKELKLPVNDVTQLSNTELLIHNFTKPGLMLMRIQPWNLKGVKQEKAPKNFGFTFAAVDATYKGLGVSGDMHILTILFDAVVGNWDREKNLSNWGYFKSGINGSVCHCPMYDFNLAHPNQINQYLHLIKPQITERHKAVLRNWRPIVEAHGYPAWLGNLDELLK